MFQILVHYKMTASNNKKEDALFLYQPAIASKIIAGITQCSAFVGFQVSLLRELKFRSCNKQDLPH